MRHSIERTTTIDDKSVKLKAEFSRDIPKPGTPEWNALFENDAAQDQFLRAAVGKKHKQMASNFLFVKKTDEGLQSFMDAATIDEVVTGKSAKVAATTDEIGQYADELGIDRDKASALLSRLRIKAAADAAPAEDVPVANESNEDTDTEG